MLRSVLRPTPDVAPGPEIEFVMAWIEEITSLRVIRSEQIYQLRRMGGSTPGGGAVVRYVGLHRSFEGDLTVDADGVVIDYPELARRIDPGCSVKSLVPMTFRSGVHPARPASPARRAPARRIGCPECRRTPRLSPADRRQPAIRRSGGHRRSGTAVRRKWVASAVRRLFIPAPFRWSSDGSARSPALECLSWGWRGGVWQGQMTSSRPITGIRISRATQHRSAASGETR